LELFAISATKNRAMSKGRTVFDRRGLARPRHQLGAGHCARTVAAYSPFMKTPVAFLAAFTLMCTPMALAQPFVPAKAVGAGAVTRLPWDVTTQGLPVLTV